MILSASSFIGKKLEERTLKLRIDLKPALTPEQLDARILRDFEENQNRQFKNTLSKLLPSKLIPVVVELSRIQPEKKIHEITKEERLRLTALLKGMEITITGLRGFNEAIITQGGVAVREMNPATMESKLVGNSVFWREKCWIWTQRQEDLIFRLPGPPEMRRALAHLPNNQGRS